MDHQLTILMLFIGFACALGAWSIAEVGGNLLQGTEARDEASDSPLFRLLVPLTQRVSRQLERLRFLDGWRDDLDRRLVMANKRDAMSPDEILGYSIMSGGLGLVVGFVLDSLVQSFSEGGAQGYNASMSAHGQADLANAAASTSNPYIWLICAVLFGMGPFLDLSSAIKKRHHKIRRVLPYTLDLLTLAVEAGLDFTAALARIGEKLTGNPFQDEIRKLTRELAMGKTRIEALKDMADRIQLEELRTVVSALAQADELGSSLGPVLRIQSVEMRRRRFQRAEKLAMEAPVKMLFPLVVFIFPLVFIVVFGPIAIRFVNERPF